MTGEEEGRRENDGGTRVRETEVALLCEADQVGPRTFDHGFMVDPYLYYIFFDPYLYKK